MQKLPLWKPLLILVTVLVCAYFLSPWDLTLGKNFGRWRNWPIEKGIDLAGGTRLIYEAKLQPGSQQNLATAIAETIDNLKKRVDPYGQRNLDWKPLGDNRIQIQMPRGNQESSALRNRYYKLHDALLAHEIVAEELDRIFGTPITEMTGEALQKARGLPDDQRAAEIARLVAGDPGRQALFERMEEAYKKQLAAIEELGKADQEYHRIQKELDQAGNLSPAATQPGHDDRVKELKARWEAAVKVYDDAKPRLDAAARAVVEARDRILSAQLTAVELDKALTSAPQARAEKLKELKARTHLDQQIDQVAEAYAKYESVKGQLDDPNDLIRLLRGSGVLDFRIGTPPPTPDEITGYRKQLSESGPLYGVTRDYRWFEIDNPESFTHSKEKLAQLLANPQSFFIDNQGRISLVAEKYDGKIYLLLGNNVSTSMKGNQGDWSMENASQGHDEKGGASVNIKLNATGGKEMNALTKGRFREQLAIVLDGRVISSASINVKHGLGADFVITSGVPGGFTPAEIEYMTKTFNAGSLKTQLSERPISIEEIGAQFGEDNLRAGLRAIYWSIILVCLFMVVYYWYWGAVANVAMLLNVVLVLAAMALFHATFTLPGIAGLILTIGISVDANILIFERIAEERERKVPLHTAIRLGFQKAFATIIDAHVTTILTCVILGNLGGTDVKGFAISLGIGLLANLFTAVFVSRVIIDWTVHLTKTQSMGMLPLRFPVIHKVLRPNIDWTRLLPLFLGISWVLVIVGVGCLWARGKNFLDIEFRSGTQVGFQLSADPATGNPRSLSATDLEHRMDEIARKYNEPVFEHGQLTIVTKGETERRGDKTYASQFSISTLVEDQKLVTKRVKEALEGLIDVKEQVAFKGSGDPDSLAPLLIDAPVYRVSTPDLRGVLPDLNKSVTVPPKFIDSLAVYLQDMHPAQTVDQIKERITRVRSQTAFQNRTVEVIGLVEDPAVSPAASPGAAAGPRFASAVVLVRGDRSDAIKKDGDLREPDGLAGTEWKIVRDAMVGETSLGSVISFSSAVSEGMTRDALMAIFLSCVGILAYLWFRFGNVRYGAGAVFALIHDVIIAVGLAAGTFYIAHTTLGRFLYITPLRLNLSMISAALTLIGYSVNDTIVVFDRIRENRGKLKFATRQIINDSINQTISRTLLTSATVFISILILYVVAGENVHSFAFVMLIGAVVGTYSSIAIAAPLLLATTRGVLLIGAALAAAAVVPVNYWLLGPVVKGHAGSGSGMRIAADVALSLALVAAAWWMWTRGRKSINTLTDIQPSSPPPGTSLAVGKK